MRKSIILDTNLFVLYLVGVYDPKLILVHRRTRAYTQTQFDVLIRLMLTAKFISVTPHIVVETSNLVRQSVEPHRSQLTKVLRAALLTPSTRFRIRNVSTLGALKIGYLVRAGFTDSALFQIVDHRTVLLTDDRDLFVLCSQVNPLCCLDFAALVGP